MCPFIYDLYGAYRPRAMTDRSLFKSGYPGSPSKRFVSIFVFNLLFNTSKNCLFSQYKLVIFITSVRCYCGKLSYCCSKYTDAIFTKLYKLCTFFARFLHAF